jgi:transcriptional regulator with XRE-family HTH domain
MEISELGLNIKHARERKGWTLNKLKQESGVGYATIHDIENGKSQSITSVNLERIAKVLDTTTNDLLGITVVEYTVEDLDETFNAVLESDELTLDGIELSIAEKEDLRVYFTFIVSELRRRRNSTR